MDVYVSKDGQQYGPYTQDELRNFLQQDNFTGGDFVCLDGETWQKISEVPGLTLEEKPVAIESSAEEQPQVEPTPHLEVKPDEVLPEVEEVQAAQTEILDSSKGIKLLPKILIAIVFISLVSCVMVYLLKKEEFGAVNIEVNFINHWQKANLQKAYRKVVTYQHMEDWTEEEKRERYKNVEGTRIIMVGGYEWMELPDGEWQAEIPGSIGGHPADIYIYTTKDNKGVKAVKDYAGWF